MRVFVDRDKCISAGQCVLAAPEVFDQDDEEGLIQLLQQNPAADLHDPVREAADNCPALAIELREQ